MTPIKNMPASVRQRLLNLARGEELLFEELLRHYCMERFLYRLSQTSNVERFVLKGALMLKIWSPEDHRLSKDIDVLGRASNESAAILAQFKEILVADVQPDGLEFDTHSIRINPIVSDAEYGGLRVKLSCYLDSAKCSLQIDIGFGDIVYPEPVKLEIPVILDDFPAPRIFCYSRESSIAEKFHAMIKFGHNNSRMKDFYDIWLLSRRFDFSGPELSQAILLSFRTRATELPREIPAFTTQFVDARHELWTSFHEDLNQPHVPESFEDIVASVELFLSPIASAMYNDSSVPDYWIAPGPWSN